MNFIKSIFVLIFTLIFVVVGASFIALSFNLFTTDEVVNFINYIYADPNIKMALGIVGSLLILVGVAIANISISRMQMQKTIAFENPDGQVTVSLSAIEDFIKKSVRHLADVKDLRSSVTASKKGINIVCRATIFSDSNIPETTERIQNIVKTKVQEMLGVEERINIKIHVTKISPHKGKSAEDVPPRDYDETSRRMPMGGA
ncbi:MAG: alkaline shock response membrane anchor protein AmaP [Candidatus Omnitrophica bacterium]|nr:alkaline shock response membrane anchor protein AmaP [Candidatus Omnitrophota bacterium]